MTNKRILLGLTGGIAAYKSADLARRLRDAGADVRVVMTRAAEDFITPLTMQTVSGHAVHRYRMDEVLENGDVQGGASVAGGTTAGMHDSRDGGDRAASGIAAEEVEQREDEPMDGVGTSPGRGEVEFCREQEPRVASGTKTERLPRTPAATMSHIELARWADLLLVAPAGANFMAKLNHGRADDLLSTVCLATGATIALAPAMNQQMWANPATQRNVFGLKQLGIHLFGPASGDQACGETGPGRMLEPGDIVTKTGALFETGVLAGLRVTVTAGPTWEAIDPVRGITNRSSGKMGYAVAAAAVEAGARVTLISGPTSLLAPDRIQRIDVSSTDDMFHAVMETIDQTDLFISIAAVADYRPKTPAGSKIKKDSDALTLELVRNPDILASVASRREAPFTVGFAAETSDVVENAQQKLIVKGIDLIAANQVGTTGSGFDSDFNALTLIDKKGTTELGQQTKTKLARELIQQIAKRFHAKNTTENSRQTYR